VVGCRPFPVARKKSVDRKFIPVTMRYTISEILKLTGRRSKSGDNKGTITANMRYLVVSKDVRRHRLISSDYITTLPCHGTATWNERA
jgi:hypothetical protein